MNMERKFDLKLVLTPLWFKIPNDRKEVLNA